MPYPDSEYPSILRGRDKRESQRLMAAAPELLAALKEIAANCERWLQDEPDGGDRLTLEICKAAIAKAEGRE